MKRIPFAGKSVFDNLVYSTRVEIARTGKIPSWSRRDFRNL